MIIIIIRLPDTIIQQIKLAANARTVRLGN